MRSASTSSRLPRRVYRPDPLAGPPPRALGAILDRYQDQGDALISVLEELQRLYGYLPEHELRYVARELGVPLAQVYGVATFYNLFQLNPPGRYCVRVCVGTACHVNRSAELLAQIAQQLGVAEDQTTADGLFTLQTVACMGACSLAPVTEIGGTIHGQMTAPKAAAILEQLRASEAKEAAA